MELSEIKHARADKQTLTVAESSHFAIGALSCALLTGAVLHFGARPPAFCFRCIRFVCLCPTLVRFAVASHPGVPCCGLAASGSAENRREEAMESNHCPGGDAFLPTCAPRQSDLNPENTLKESNVLIVLKYWLRKWLVMSLQEQFCQFPSLLAHFPFSVVVLSVTTSGTR